MHTDHDDSEMHLIASHHTEHNVEGGESRGDEQRSRGAEEQRSRGAEEQRSRGAEEQRNRGAEEQRNSVSGITADASSSLLLALCAFEKCQAFVRYCLGTKA
jgi:hypothetical protein